METKIVINEVVPGLNTFLKSHWTKLHKLKNRYQLLCMEQTRNRHKGAVEIRLTRFTTRFMDTADNLPSTAKLLMDAIKEARIIVDDSPEYVSVPDGYPKQIKCKRSEQRTEIIISDL